MRRVLLWPVIAVSTLVATYAALDPFDKPAREAVQWPALSDFYAGQFTANGFRSVCDVTTTPECRVEWQHPSDKKTVVEVYQWGDQQLRREEILAGFHEQAKQIVPAAEAARLTAVLDGFFHSGLRRRADRAIRRARNGAAWSLHLPPFELGEKRLEGGRELVDVVGLDASDAVIVTGLPRRPSYRADVYAKGWHGSAAAVRITQGDRAPVVRLLRPGATAGCTSISPESEEASAPCRSVQITPCATGNDCSQAVMEVHAASNDLLLVRAGQNAAAKLVSRHGFPMKVGDLLASRPGSGVQEPLYVRAVDKSVADFRVELIHGAAVPVSRQRMVNGRWERWYSPAVQPWLKHVVGDWQRIADTGEPKINPAAQVTLSLDASLQQDLERRLAEWMRAPTQPKNLPAPEAAVRNHLINVHNRPRRSLDLGGRESVHRRPVPHAGITVLDARTGSILAVASYPPASALAQRDGEPDFAPGWRARLAGTAPPWMTRDILEVLQGRIEDDVNANFITHPIGSTFKPILLSLMIDRKADGLDRLFNLVVAGHQGATGGAGKIECTACAGDSYQAVVGLPLGPWGTEDGTGGHGGDPWIDRADFLVASCNKYAVALGVLSFFDWQRQGLPPDACCWNDRRDTFGFNTYQPPTGGAAPVDGIVSRRSDLPPLGSSLTAQHSRIATNAEFANAPVFSRLRTSYGVTPREDKRSYDPDPWHPCVAAAGQKNADPLLVGNIERTQLRLTEQFIGPAFTNLFTGAGHNWWNNIKLAEAYARMAMNSKVTAGFCGGQAGTAVFADTSRHGDLVQILSRQREASWVDLPAIKKWIGEVPGRITLSKTGTTLRAEGYESTGVFAIYIGKGDGFVNGLPTRAGDGIVVIAYVDDVGGSPVVTSLVDTIFPALRPRLE